MSPAVLPDLRKVPALLKAAVVPVSAPPKFDAKMKPAPSPLARKVAPLALLMVPLPARVVPLMLLLRLMLPPVQVSVALFCSTRPESSSSPEALIVVGRSEEHTSELQSREKLVF